MVLIFSNTPLTTTLIFSNTVENTVLIIFSTFENIVLTPSMLTPVLLSIQSSMPEKNDLIPFHTASHNALIAPNAISNNIFMVSQIAVMKFTITSHIPKNTCFTASQAPCQSPLNTDEMKSATPLIISIKPSKIPPRLSHSTLNQDKTLSPQLLQNTCIHPNTVSITAAIALKMALPTSYNASHTADNASNTDPHTARSLSFVLAVELSMLSSAFPNSVAASCEINVHTPSRKVLMIPHALSKFCRMLSPCFSKKPLTVSAHIKAACLMKSHTPSRNS